jgi:hypothetical protein
MAESIPSKVLNVAAGTGTGGTKNVGEISGSTNALSNRVDTFASGSQSNDNTTDPHINRKRALERARESLRKKRAADQQIQQIQQKQDDSNTVEQNGNDADGSDDDVDLESSVSPPKQNRTNKKRKRYNTQNSVTEYLYNTLLDSGSRVLHMLFVSGVLSVTYVGLNKIAAANSANLNNIINSVNSNKPVGPPSAYLK